MSKEQREAGSQMGTMAFLGLSAATLIAAGVTLYQGYHTLEEEVHVEQSPVVQEHIGPLRDEQKANLDSYVDHEMGERNGDAAYGLAAGVLTVFFAAGSVPEFRRRRATNRAKSEQKRLDRAGARV